MLRYVGAGNESERAMVDRIGERKWRQVLWTSWRDSLALLGAFLLLILLFSSLSDRFLTTATLTTVANQIPALTLIATGMTFVIIVGGIDLSVGSLMAVSGVVFGWLALSCGWPTPISIIAALTVAAACGLVNGLVTVTWSVPSFIVTLGMLEVARGASYLVANSQTQYVETRLDALAAPIPRLGISPAFVLAVALVLLCHLLLRKTVWGRHVIAAGDNGRALKLSGIDPRWSTAAVFVLAGVLAGMAGIVETARLATADPNAGVGKELEAIAAVVIGGTSLTGGRGSVISTFLGVLIISVLQPGLSQVGVSEPMKRVVTGAVIVAAVILDVYRQKWSQQST